MSDSRFLLSIVLAAGLVLAPVAGPAHAQSLDWEEAPQFDVEIDGKPDVSTRAYQPEGSKPYIIVLSDRLDHPVLIDLSRKSVSELVKSDVKPSGEFTIATQGIPKGRSRGSYKFADGASTFSLDDAAISMRVKESLVGEVTQSIILAHSPLYATLRDAYTPNAKTIKRIRAVKKKTDIVVMFASWCPTCKKVIPKFFRVLRDAANSHFSVRYIGIAMGGTEPRPLLEKYGYEYPDIIVFQDGKEKGRVTGEPGQPLEDALLRVLTK
jgi:thiol-disulfide isomerase/thioredoxin